MIEPDHHAPVPELTPTGQARRHEMLDELLGVLSRTHRRRRARRIALSGAAVLALAFCVFRLERPDGSVAPRDGQRWENQPFVEKTLLSPTPPPEPPVKTNLLFVYTDPTTVARFRAAPVSTITRLTDGELLDTLESIGRPAGLIRFGDRVALSEPVTDHD